MKDQVKAEENSGVQGSEMKPAPRLSYCDDCKLRRRWVAGNSFQNTVDLCPKHAATDALVRALKYISMVAGNLSDEAVESVNGVNDARSRAMMVTTARSIARAALSLAKEEEE